MTEFVIRTKEMTLCVRTQSMIRLVCSSRCLPCRCVSFPGHTTWSVYDWVAVPKSRDNNQLPMPGWVGKLFLCKNWAEDWWSLAVDSFHCSVFVADTRPISHRVGRSVTLCFFCIFGHFKGWKICTWACPCLNHYCPCQDHYCPCPNHYCPCPNHYCPCPTVRDRSSRVYGLVFSFCRGQRDL